MTDLEGATDEAAAAFQAGAALLQNLTWENIELAKEAFELAAATGAVDMLWAVADAYVNTTLELLPTRRWMQQAIAAEWVGCEFEVDPEVFAVIAFADSDPEDPYVSHQDWHVRVVSQPPHAARIALESAGPRLMQVQENGHELVTDEEWANARGELYTPNFISPVNVDPAGGASIWLDCKDGVMPQMARTDLRIIVEELRAAGASWARIGPERTGDFADSGGVDAP